MHIHRNLIVIVALFLIVCAVQATVLQITVRDDTDNTRLEDASIYINGKYLGKTDADGEYSYNHTKTSSFTLKVTKSGYDEWSDDISKDRTSITVDLLRDTTKLTVIVYDADTIQPLKDAKVDIISPAETVSKRTDSSGKAAFDLIKEEEYSIEVTDPDYETQTREIETGSSDTTINIWLFHGERFAIRILDEDEEPLAGATITIDSKLIGTTGSDGVLITHLESGRSYQIRVNKEGYITYDKKQSIPSNAIILDITLQQAIYSVTISVVDENNEPVSNADVYLDGTKKGTTDESGSLGAKNIIEGTYNIRIVKQGYVTWEGSREISEEIRKITLNLLFEKAEVSIIVEDTDAKPLSGTLVRANGETIGITDNAGMLTTDLNPATYNFSATLDGYKTAYIEKVITPGTDAVTVTLILEPELDLFLISLAVIGIAVVILLVIVGSKFFLERQPRQRGRRGF